MLSHHSRALEGEIFNSLSKVWIHIRSTVALAIALYFASVLDHENVGCFFADHEIRLGQKKTANPPVDFLSSRQLAQSVSEKALTRVENDFLI
jgi:hypothetical protein